MFDSIWRIWQRFVEIYSDWIPGMNWNHKRHLFWCRVSDRLDYTGAGQNNSSLKCMWILSVLLVALSVKVIVKELLHSILLFFVPPAKHVEWSCLYQNHVSTVEVKYLQKLEQVRSSQVKGVTHYFHTKLLNYYEHYLHDHTCTNQLFINTPDSFAIPIGGEHVTWGYVNGWLRPAGTV